MDGEKIWVYVVLAVIYGLSRLLKRDQKKPAQAPPKTNPPRESPDSRRRKLPERKPSPVAAEPVRRPDPVRRQEGVRRPEPAKQLPKAMSFEELMREIMEAKTTPPRQEPVVDYDDEIGEEARGLEDVNYDNRKDSEVMASYERARREAFSRPSLEETMKVGDTVVSFGKFKEFERTEGPNLAERYLNDFRDLGAVRKAVVMSEILKRKF